VAAHEHRVDLTNTAHADQGTAQNVNRRTSHPLRENDEAVPRLMDRSGHAVSGSAMCSPCRSAASHSARSELVSTTAPTKTAAARWTAS